MTNPWLDPSVAQQQRALVDRQLAEKPWPPHFTALVEAVRATECPGELLEVGCASGYGREILDRARVPYRSYSGVDISAAAIDIAKERYPESQWETCAEDDDLEDCKADTVIDGCSLMHVDDWRAHLAALCRASRRHVILHRVPFVDETHRFETEGYGQKFPAWAFFIVDIVAEMEKYGFVTGPGRLQSADAGSLTLTFAKPRHFASYCDAAYLPRLKALHASMVRHCSPFVLHILAWDEGVKEWCFRNGLPYCSIDNFLHAHPELGFGELPGPPRTKIEMMWTAGPRFIADIMKGTGEPVTYVDADVMFFSSPEPMFAEIGGAPAAVVPHGFAEASRGLPGPTRETHEVFGKFNVGIVYAAARPFVENWSEACRDWCFDRVERTSTGWVRYGDQKYLDELARHYRVHVIQHPGACAGPWQAHARALDVRDGVVHFGNRPLIAYHFSGYREGPHGAESLSRPEYQISERQAELIYRPYVAALQEAKTK